MNIAGQFPTPHGFLCSHYIASCPPRSPPFLILYAHTGAVGWPVFVGGACTIQGAGQDWERKEICLKHPAQSLMKQGFMHPVAFFLVLYSYLGRGILCKHFGALQLSQ